VSPAQVVKNARQIQNAAMLCRCPHEPLSSPVPALEDTICCTPLPRTCSKRRRRARAISEVSANQDADGTEENWVCFANFCDHHGLRIHVPHNHFRSFPMGSSHAQRDSFRSELPLRTSQRFARVPKACCFALNARLSLVYFFAPAASEGGGSNWSASAASNSCTDIDPENRTG
jgi:hypothetical protein